jgi:hypothetical protein
MAVGIDPNECIYPIVVGVIEVESTSTWKWFLATLKNDLGIPRVVIGIPLDFHISQT